MAATKIMNNQMDQEVLFLTNTQAAMEEKTTMTMSEKTVIRTLIHKGPVVINCRIIEDKGKYW